MDTSAPQPQPHNAPNVRPLVTTNCTRNDEFRCSMCLKLGSMGWLYRCTQDRELIIDDDLERKCQDEFDQLPKLIDFSTEPRKRSVAARISGSLSFFDEITEEQLKTYTPEQLDIILEQRSKVLELAKQTSTTTLRDEALRVDLPQGSNSLSAFPMFSPSSSVDPKKPYLPSQECQFKVCQLCRPTSRERSYLSLDAVADGEISPIALTGFGFHLQRRRPVALVTHVKNLGLRSSPIQQPQQKEFGEDSDDEILTSTPPSASPVANTHDNSPFDDKYSLDTTFGQPSNAYDTAAMTRNVNVEPSTSYQPYKDAIERASSKAPLQGMFKFRQCNGPDVLSNTPTVPAHQFRDAFTPHNSPLLQPELAVEDIEGVDAGSWGRSPNSLRTNSRLRSLFNLDVLEEHGEMPGMPLCQHPVESTAVPVAQVAEAHELREPAGSQVLFEVAEEEVVEEGHFGSQSLDVPHGVALTEEAVVSHVPDVITQFQFASRRLSVDIVFIWNEMGLTE